MATPVVTEIIIDARGATQGSADYIRAMRAAQAAADRTLDTSRALQSAVDQTGATMMKSAQSIKSMEQAWQRMAGAVDPATAAWRKYTTELDRITTTSDNAIRRLGKDAAEVERIAAAARRAATATYQQSSGFVGPTNDPQTIQRAAEARAAEVKQLDSLREKYIPILAAERMRAQGMADIQKLSAAGKLSEEERVTAVNRVNVAYGNTMTVIKRQSEDAAKGGRLVSGELTNLSFQLNDIVTGLALGQSPFMIMAQQGGQVYQVLANSKVALQDGLGASLKALASTVIGFFTPFRLLVIGIVGLVALGYSLYSSWKTAALQLDDTARAAGTTTRAMRELQSIASFKGIESKDFVSAAEGFATQVYLARRNLGGLAEVFRANNTQAGNFNDSLLIAADLIAKAGSDQQRLVLLQQMGLPATMQWVRFLQQGADGIRAAREQAGAFGGAAEDNLIANARRADEAWSRFWTNFGNYADRVWLSTRSGVGWLIEQADTLIARLLAAALKIPQGRGLAGSMLLQSGTQMTQGAANDFYRATGAAAGDSTIDKDALQKTIALEQQRIGILGQTAAIELQVHAVELQIRQARLNGVTILPKEEENLKRIARERALGVDRIIASTEAAKIEIATLGMSTEQATVYAAVQGRINEARRNGQVLTVGEIREIQMQAEAYGKVTAELERMRGLQQGLDSFFSSLVNGLMSGKTAAESFAAGLQSLGSSLQQIGTKNLSQGLMGIFKGQGFSGFDPASLGMGAVGIGVSLLGKLFGPDQEAERQRQALEQAQKAWRDMTVEVEKFVDKMQGTQRGSLTQALSDAADELNRLVQSAYDARDMAGSMKLQTDFLNYVNDQVTQFVRQWGNMIDAMRAGLGFDSPFVKGAQAISDLADKVKGFVTDTRVALSGGTIFNPGRGYGVDTSSNPDVSRTINNILAQGNRWGLPGVTMVGGGNLSVDAAQQAGQQYLLSVLAGAPALSDVASKLMEAAGNAQALQGALQDLGMTADEASRAITERLGQAIDKIRVDFLDGLQRKINDATGQGFVNDMLDLFKQVEQARADAALLGTGTDLVDRYFTVQAQKIVDGAGLVGDSFQSLIDQFPQLTSVIHESTQALEEQRAAMTAAARSIVDYINGINTGTQSNLSPSARLAAAQATYNAQLTLAQSNNTDALSRITQDAESLRTALQGMYGSSASFQQGWLQIQQQLLQLPVVATSDDPIVTAVRDVVTAIAAMQSTQLTQAQIAALGLSTDATAAQIRAATQGTQTYTSQTVTRLDTSIGRFDTTISRLGDVVNSLGTTIATLLSGNSLLDQIRALNSTSSQQLALLNQQLTVGDVGIAAGTATAYRWVQTGDGSWVLNDYQTPTGVTSHAAQYGQHDEGLGYFQTQQAFPSGPVSNTLISALNKIVINTAAIAFNTAEINWRVSVGGNRPAGYRYGIFAEGGVIPPYGLGLVSEHSPGGGRFVRAGAEPIIVSPFAPSNDNSATAAEQRRTTAAINRLHDRIAQLESRVIAAELASAEHVGEKIGEMTEVSRDTNKRARRA